ncbi:HD-GYP domain-containing protein [Azonexus sp.]|uniref:HD-GYP domain-containing protein n=1 Tax=Azonexus sp. TaxID=1872668 RepID=UPI0035B022DF
MNAFNRRTARRIAAVSIVLAAVASPLAWFVAQENAEQDSVALAMEETRRLLGHSGIIDLSAPDAQASADKAAKVIAGGLFDIAEIYDGQGEKLAEAMTRDGAGVEALLPPHDRPRERMASYESLVLPGGQWVLRIFVPLLSSTGVTGYFEGVRIVPEWQREQMLSDALSVALIVGLASLLCGAAIYPVVVHLSADNERKARAVLESHVAMMEALGRAIAKRDSDTGAHNYRVAWIAAGIAERMGLAGQAMQSLIAGSFLHDVGKIGIPDAILLKPGRLDDAEMAVMRTHVALGEEIVSDIGWLAGAHEVVAGHHEKWDGSGYPRRLAGEAIPLAARIFAVVDVFDALCSKRPYKDPLPLDSVLAILEEGRGAHFDPAVLDVFLPQAREVYGQLAGCDEAACRALLEERIRAHFGL